MLVCAHCDDDNARLAVPVQANIAIDLALVFIAGVSLAAVYLGDDLYRPPLPTEVSSQLGRRGDVSLFVWLRADPLPHGPQVFHGCSSKVGKQCQLCLSVIADKILSRGSMTCIASTPADGPTTSFPAAPHPTPAPRHAVGLCACASMIRVFGNERVEYWREASGLSQPK